jgi:hypothetical protein
MLALAVTGCATLGEQPWPWQLPSEAPPTKPAVAGPQSVPRRVVEPPPPRPAKPKSPVEAALPDKAPPVALVGMSEEETAAALGRPADEAEQPPGKVWTYEVDGCRLAVHLFLDMDRGGFYALDYTAGEAPKDWCLGRVAQEARRPR